jgi:hypothetical protein
MISKTTVRPYLLLFNARGKSQSGDALPPVTGEVLSAIGCHRHINAALRPMAQTSPGLPLSLAIAPCLAATGRVSLGSEGIWLLALGNAAPNREVFFCPVRGSTTAIRTSAMHMASAI